jgi:hypothetical protein
VPECYIKVKKEIDLMAIKTDLKAGAVVPGFKIEERQNINIK